MNQTTQLASGLMNDLDPLAAEAVNHHTRRVCQRGGSGHAGVGGGGRRTSRDQDVAAVRCQC
jgi:hypothetical protein